MTRADLHFWAMRPPLTRFRANAPTAETTDIRGKPMRCLILVLFALVGCDKKGGSSDPEIGPPIKESGALPTEQDSRPVNPENDDSASGDSEVTSLRMNPITGAKEVVMNDLFLGETPQWKLSVVGKPGSDAGDPNAVWLLLDLEEDNWRQFQGTLEAKAGDLKPKNLRYLACHKAQQRPTGEYEAVAKLEVVVDGSPLSPAFNPIYSGSVVADLRFETASILFWDRGRSGNALTRLRSARTIELRVCQDAVTLDDAAVAKVRALVQSTFAQAPL